MPLTTCPSPADLERLFLGGLPEKDAEALERHALDCGPCMAKLKSLLNSKDTLSGVLSDRTASDTASSSPAVEELIKKLESLRPSPKGSAQGDTPMIAFTCSACSNKLSVKPQQAGKKVTCPACGMITTVPVPQGSPGIEEDRTLPPSADPDKPATRPSLSELDATAGVEGEHSSHDASLSDFLAPPQANDELGRLGKYRILKVLGHGGMGVVYKAEDPLLKRTVALKAMLPGLAASPTSAKRFLREAQAMAAVEHDHIVRIYQVDEDRNVPFMAMEFLRGEPLDERLKREEKMPLAEVLRIGREIAEGLSAAHANDLIHRDIKPGNIWLESPRHRVKILDFGLARAASQDSCLTQQGAIIGTPAYMAPEQGRGESVDDRTDLFSLGVILYRLCSGQQPFRGNDTVSTIMEVALHEPPPPAKLNAEVPPELSELVMKLLEKDPAKRVASAGEVVEALQAMERKLQGGERFEGTKPVPVSVPPRRRSKAMVAVAALFAALVVVAGSIFFWQTPDGKVVRIECDDPSIKIAFDDGELKVTGAYKEPITLKPGKVGLKISRKGENGDDFEFETDKFIVNKGEKIVLRIVVEQGKLQIVRGDKVIDEAPFSKEVEAPWLAADKLGPEAKRFAIDKPARTVGMEVQGKEGQATAVKILELDNPPLASHEYKLRGRIRHDKVAGVGHVEMWSQFADGKAYFSKTLAEAGPLGKLQGTSDWRDIELPFFSKPGMLPKKLWVNVVLPGAGTVYLEPLKLSPVKKDVKWRTEDGPSPSDADRKAAEWVLSLGGSVRLNGQVQDINAVAKLPPGPVQLDYVDLANNPKVSDTGLAHLKDCKNLTGFNLQGTPLSDAVLAHLKDCKKLTQIALHRTRVSDAGLAHFKECKDLLYLYLDGTKVSDAGLAHFKECKNLRELFVDDTQIGDVGLAHVKGCKELNWLRVRKTRVTAQGLEHFRAVLPGCKIEHDGGVIEPK